MIEDEAVEELLFFDTFAHDTSEEINLDLVQFPKPVIISEVRIIPLGARVQADFPGGVRLGATNPSQFHIEFFVNDLSKHGAATFECLGGLEYSQTTDINLVCHEKMPTDGLVLRGWYSTITLALYGSLSKAIPPPPPLPDPLVVPEVTSSAAATAEWVQSQQDTLYRDEGYSYNPSNSCSDLWSAPTTQVVPACDNYIAGSWEPSIEVKQWVGKDSDVVSPMPNEQWIEGSRQIDEEPKRRIRTPEEPSWTHTRAHRDCSWDRGKSESRRPRSPSPRSPKRPKTPIETRNSSMDLDYRSPECIKRVISPKSPLDSPGQILHNEHFEPILSDDDMPDETHQQYQDMDYDSPDDVEDVILHFNPFTFVPKKLKEWFFDRSACESDRVVLKTISEVLNSSTLTADEQWVQSAENVISLIPSELSGELFDTEIKNVLLSWVQFGLDFEMALSHAAPGLKLRHTKAGLRLAQLLCHCGMAGLLVTQVHLQQRLIELYHQKHMSLSIRILILQTFSASLLETDALRHCLDYEYEIEYDGKIESGSCYEHIFRILRSNHQVRIKFALTAILQKIHLDEVLSSLEEAAYKIVYSDETPPINEVVLCIQTVEACLLSANYLTEPHRFLPVHTQFHINNNPNTAYEFIFKYFRKRKLLESLGVMLTAKAYGASVQTVVCAFLQRLAGLPQGLVFVTEDPRLLTNILKALHNMENETCLALELPFRLHTLSCLEQLESFDDELDLTAVLHQLSCSAISTVGKRQVATTLAMEPFFQTFLKIWEKCPETSVAGSYCADLLEMTIRFSSDVTFIVLHHSQILDLGHSQQEHHVDALLPCVKLLASHADDVPALCEVIKAHGSQPFTDELSPELVTAVRRLYALCIVPETTEQYNQLKYQQCMLQFQFHDGLTHLTSVLSKILLHYDQPFAHSSTLVCSSGQYLLNFLNTALSLMQKILSNLISVLAVEYKDVTHIPILLDIYALVKAVPSAAEAQCASRKIVQMLLVYTDPSAQSPNYAKSLWTQMIGEVLKFTLKSPYCFVPGLEVLSQLLPLPLPIQCGTELRGEEITELVAARELWSAHIHPLAGPVHDLIATMCTSSHPTLLQLLRRTAIQFSDLAAPTALIIARAIIDPLLSALPTTEGDSEVPVSGHATRLLHFLACIILHPAIKAAVMSLIPHGTNGGTALVESLLHVLGSSGSTSSNTQSQESVLLILQALLDSDISLVPLNGDPELFQNALPPRQVLSEVTLALLQHIAETHHPMPCLLLALKSLILLTDHDYGFYSLKEGLENRQNAIYGLLSRLSTELSRDHMDSLNALHGTLALLREFVLDAPTPMRKLTMTRNELGRVLRWGHASHPLYVIHNCLQEWAASDTSLKNLHESAADLIKILASSSPETVSSLSKDDEPVMSAALPLLEQYSRRTVVMKCEPDAKCLTEGYLLGVPANEEIDQDGDFVHCDLIQLTASFIPDLDLVQQVDLIFNLKPSVKGDSEADAIKYLPGHNTRKPYVTPMRLRGAGRTAGQQRGDVFRCRPPNTSRPPSLHVDDFLALETCGQQPTGPTGYNKVSVRNLKDVMGSRMRGRGRIFGGAAYQRRDSPRGGPARHFPSSRFHNWQPEGLHRIHPFPR